MSKAYDWVECGLFRAMMEKMGFQKELIDTVMKCISTISYLISINGAMGDSFLPSQGLRQ